MPKKVVVVDDSSTIRKEVGHALTSAGFLVLEASDGAEGVAILDRHLDTDLVICDVNMPNMGGFEMLASLKRDAKRAALPVIMLTTEGDPALIRRAKSAGAKAWIVKPFKPDLLVATVRKLVTAVP